MSDLYAKITEKYPFISHITYGNLEYVGIIQNKDNTITSIYDYEKIKDDELKKIFLELGDIWWWESNRQIPINIFLKKEWAIFKVILTTFNSKDCEIVNGPYVSLSEISQKRVKRRSIQLVRRVTPKK